MNVTDVRRDAGKFAGLHDFLLIWFGQLISGVGSRLTSFAFGVWVYETTGSITKFAMVFVAMAVPALLIAPFAGALVDRWDRRRIMIACEIVSAAVIATMALLVATGHISMWMIYAGVGLSAITNTFLQPAYAASVPLLADREQLTRVNGLIQIGNGLSLVGGPALAGILMKSMGLAGVLVVDALSFLVGAVCIVWARIPRPVRESVAEGNLWREAYEGWRYVAERRGLLGLLGIGSVDTFLFSIASIVITPLVLIVAHQDKNLLGLQMSLGCCGLLVGGALVTIWGGPRRKIDGLLGFSIVSGLALAAHALVPSYLWLVVFGFVMFVCIPPAQSAGLALWQTKVPSHLLGRCMAILRMTSEAVSPLGYLLAGPLAEHVFEPAMMPGGALAGSMGQLLGVGPGRGLALMFLLVGVSMVAVAIVGYAMRSVRRVEQDLPDAPLVASI